MQHETLDEAQEKMRKSVETFQEEISHIRTGRATTGLVDAIEVDVYGSRMRVNELATTSVPEARMITIQPWDKNNVGPIEKAIMNSPLEITPQNDGTIIRIVLPDLSEERRKEYTKLIGKLAEEARVSIRNIRRHEIDEIKKQQKDGDLPEDEAHKLSDEIQKITDKFVGEIEDLFKKKEAEIMEV